MGTQEVQLSSARLELDSRRRKKEKMRDETDKVAARVDLWKRFVVPPVDRNPVFMAEINK